MGKYIRIGGLIYGLIVGLMGFCDSGCGWTEPILIILGVEQFVYSHV